MRGILIGLSLIVIAFPASAKECRKIIGHDIHVRGKITLLPNGIGGDARYKIDGKEITRDCDGATAALVTVAASKIRCEEGHRMLADGTLDGEDDKGTLSVRATNFSCR